MTIKRAKALPRQRCPNCDFIGPQPIFNPQFKDELFEELNAASGTGVNVDEISGRTGDEIYGIYLYLVSGKYQKK